MIVHVDMWGIQEVNIIFSKLIPFFKFFFVFFSCTLMQTIVITCSSLATPSNGTRLGCPGNATMYYDTFCQFSCNNGYIGSGSQVRRCQQNGMWSGQEFTCRSTIFNTLWPNIDQLGVAFNTIFGSRQISAVFIEYSKLAMTNFGSRFFFLDGQFFQSDTIIQFWREYLWTRCARLQECPKRYYDHNLPISVSLSCQTR